MIHTLKTLVDLRQNTFQRGRIGMSNRLSAAQRGDSERTFSETATLHRWESVLAQRESELDRDIETLARQIPIVSEMLKVKGMGIMYAARLVSEIDIHRCDTVSVLWKRCGLGIGKYWVNSKGDPVAPEIGYKWVVANGKRVRMKVTPTQAAGWTLREMPDRLVAGYLANYSPQLKVTMYNVGQSFIKARSPYKEVYDKAKTVYTDRKWSKSHAANAALRKMEKMFLSHLWEVWREMEGLSVKKPYVEEVLGHEHIYRPEDFGWRLEYKGRRK